MRYLKTYENDNFESIKVRSNHRMNFYEAKYLKCEQSHNEMDVIQIFTIPESSQEHFGFIVFKKNGEMLFEVRGNQTNRILTQEQVKELSFLMEYFKVIREVEKYNM